MRKRYAPSMRSLSIIAISLFIGCSSPEKNYSGKASDYCRVDYKSDTYKLFLDERKDSIEKFIELQRDFESGNHSTKDSLKHFFSVNEPLIRLSKSASPEHEVLPALYFTMSDGQLVAFESPIIFTPNSVDSIGFYSVLKDFENYFPKLKSDINKSKLAGKLFLDFSDDVKEEKFWIDTAKSQLGILFNYSIKRKKRRIT